MEKEILTIATALAIFAEKVGLKFEYQVYPEQKQIACTFVNPATGQCLTEAMSFDIINQLVIMDGTSNDVKNL